MITLENTSIKENEYQKRAAVARQNFASREIVKELFSQEIEPKLLKLFMIHWNALNAGLTEPIPVYLKRAGERCEEMGLNSMAEFFYEHEHEEDGHENWAIDDVEELVALWNQEEPNYQLNTQELLAKKMSPAVKRYHQLHEQVLEGNSPWAELAIDIEIELLSTSYGPILVKKWIDCMGQSSLSKISFLHKHVTADVGHTDTNFDVVDQFISEHPESVEMLAETAAAALNVYADFLEDAMAYTKEVYGKLNN